MCVGKERCDFAFVESCNTTSDAGYEEGEFGVVLSEGDKFVDVWPDGFHPSSNVRKDFRQSDLLFCR